MKAAQISEYGDSSVIHIINTDKPTVGKGQVLVGVHASSINPFDTIVRSGYMKEMIPLSLPITLGGDISGVVVEIGEGVTDVEVGDKVFGQANVVSGNSGAFAEFAVTSAEQIYYMPRNLDFNQAASLPLVGASALEALTEYIAIKPGQKIFINGGSGGIGSIAIQIAKNIGAFVATTATSEGLGIVKKLGADQIIDYKSQNFVEVLQDFDAIFDTVGGDGFNDSFSILNPGGVAVTMAAQPNEAKAKERGITAIAQMTSINKAVLKDLNQLVEHGIVKPQIDRVFPLSQIREAFEYKESGKVTGKIVISIDQ